MANGGDPRLKYWSLILIVGCSLMFVAFFMPWWGLTMKVPARPERPTGANATQEDLEAYKKDVEKLQKDMEKVQKVQKRNDRWYENKIPDRTREKFEEEVKEGMKDDKGTFYSTMRLWGWSTGVGLTAFIFSIVLLPVAIVPIFVKLLRNWIWIGYFVAAVSGLVLFILSLVWYFSSPGENVPDYVWQGVGLSPGPYMEIFGSLATLTSGVLGGVFGLLHFLKSLKSGSRGTAAAPPPESAPPEFED